MQALRSGPWKLFLPVEAARHPHFGPEQPPQLLLFNVETDIASQHNVADEHPQVVQRLLLLAERGRVELGDRGRAGSGQRPPGRLAADEQPRGWRLEP